MNTRTRSYVILALLMAAHSAAADSDFLKDSVKARAIVAQAIAAAGGRAAIEGLQQLQYRADGTARNILQDFDPQAEPGARAAHSVFVLDFKNDRFYQSIDIAINGVNAIPAPLIYKNGQAYTLSPFEKQYGVVRGNPGPSFDGPARPS